MISNMTKNEPLDIGVCARCGGSLTSDHECPSFISEETDKTETFLIDIQKSGSIENAPRIVARIKSLFEYGKEAGEEEISLGSLSYLHKFLRKYPKIDYPDILVTVRNNLQFRWKESINKLFSVEFFPDGTVRFVNFAHNPKHPDRVDRLQGSATIDTVFDSVTTDHRKRRTK